MGLSAHLSSEALLAIFFQLGVGAHPILQTLACFSKLSLVPWKMPSQKDGSSSCLSWGLMAERWGFYLQKNFSKLFIKLLIQQFTFSILQDTSETSWCFVDLPLLNATFGHRVRRHTTHSLH